MSTVTMGTVALARLMARPATLWLLLPLAWALAFSLLRAAESHPEGLSAGGVVVREAVWQAIALVSAVLGVTASLSRLELQHSVISWTIPSLGERLRAGTITFGIVVAALASSAAMAGVASSIEIVVMAAGLSLLCTAMAGVLVDAAMSLTARWRAGLALFVPAVRPDWTEWLAVRAGLPLGLALAVVALLAWRAQFSADASRRRPFLFSGLVAVPSGPALRTFWSRSATEREWRAPLTSSRVAPWLRAAAYEGFAWRGPSYLGNRLIMAAVAVFFSHATGNPAMLMLIGIALGTRPLQLSHARRYPLARRDRAPIAFAGTLVDGLVLAALCAALVPVLTLVPPPSFLLPDEPRPTASWPLAIAALFALAPVAQWSAARGQVFSEAVRGRAMNTARVFVPWLLYAVGVVAVAGTLARLADPVRAAALLVILGATVYGAHYVSLRAYYRRADLA